MVYRLPVDIVNRALQHLGRRRIFTLTDQTAQAGELNFAYDMVRAAELRRNLWRFATKRVVLRPLDTVTAVLATSGSTASGAVLPFTDTTGVLVGQLVTGTNIAAGSTVLSIVVNTSVTLSLAISGTVGSGAAITFGPLSFTWTPPTYAAGTTYLVGQVVVDSAGDWWQSKIAGNIGNTPTVGAPWMRYSGNDTMQTWDTAVSYSPGELALASTGAVYMSLISGGQEGHDPVTTTGFWRIVNGTATGLSILYPIGAGPRSDSRTNNVYRLPRGYLRQAPTSPRGTGGYLGFSRGTVRENWTIEGDYIVSPWGSTPLLLRYVADWVDVPEMDSLFCEMLASRLAAEMAPSLVEPAVMALTLSNCRSHYRSERLAAISANAIEVGPIEYELDDYIAARV